MLYSIKTREGIFNPPNGKRWTIGEEAAKKYVVENKYQIINNNFYIKKFDSDYKKGSFKLHNNLLDNHGSLKTAKSELEKLDFNREDFDTPKPEKLLERIIELSTKKGDIVLDYHLGSGTTCAVAHKMGRQYIGIEQMDYIEDIAVKRMQKVIGTQTKKDGELLDSVDFDNGGISKSVDWQGGGEFVYFELSKYNQQYIDKLSIATDKTILKLYDEIINKAFLNYDVDNKKLSEEKNEFKSLNFSDKQEFLVSILNKNQLYKNLAEMNDKDLSVSDKTKKLNTDFYAK
jgi:adenine-specific DNA-methyltransferase